MRIIRRKIADRKSEVKLRKYSLPMFVLMLLVWLILAGLIYFSNPQTLGAIPIFFVLVLLASYLTCTLVFANARRGVIAAFSLTLFLVLRLIGVGNVLNLFLIAALAIVVEIYFSRKAA